MKRCQQWDKAVFAINHSLCVWQCVQTKHLNLLIGQQVIFWYLNLYKFITFSAYLTLYNSEYFLFFFPGNLSWEFILDVAFYFCNITPLFRLHVPPPCRAELIAIKTTNSRIQFTNSIMEPKVGVGVFILNSEGKFIIGKRKGSHGAGMLFHSY